VLVFPVAISCRDRTTAFPFAVICRVRTAVFPLVVIAVVCLAARTFVFERTWSFPWAAIASDPVIKAAPVTTLISMRFVFISLIWF